MADVHHARHRVDADARELVGPGRGGLGDRRARDQQRRRALPAARGPPPRPGLAADVRAGGDRAEGPDAAVEPLHQPGGAHARLRRRTSRSPSSAASTRWRTTSSRCSRSTSGRASRCGSRRWWPSSPRATPRPATRWRRPGRRRCATPDFDEALARHAVGLGRAVARLRRRACPATTGCSCCCGCTSATSCRSARVTPPTWTPACRPAASTARPTAGTCSGTSSTSIRS